MLVSAWLCSSSLVSQMSGGSVRPRRPRRMQRAVVESLELERFVWSNALDWFVVSGKLEYFGGL